MMPAASIQATEPPPAPTERTSTIGTAIGMPHSSSEKVVSAGSPARISPVSKLVPPMSAMIRFANCTSLATYEVAITPPAGPERTIETGFSRAPAGVITPPLERITSRSPMPRSRPSSLSSAA